MTTEPIIFSPFYDYLEKRREVLLTELDAIERVMGVSPRTAEMRKRYKQIEIGKNDSVAGVVKTD